VDIVEALIVATCAITSLQAHFTHLLLQFHETTLV